MQAPALALDNVSYGYGDRPVLAGVSLPVAAGTIVGLLGQNGAGKTTLVRLAAGTLAPSAGHVTLAGKQISTLRRAEIARAIAVVPQGGELPLTFTGWEIALIGRTPHLGWLQREGPDDMAIARRALAQADALHLADRQVGAMSGGERQRLLLARALAQEPRVLLLDEPTVHLDLAHQVGLLELVRMLARTTGLAVLAVFHDLNLAAAYCDEIAFLSNGRLLARGQPSDVMTPDVLRDVYGLDLVVVTHPQTGRPAILPPADGVPMLAFDARRSG